METNAGNTRVYELQAYHPSPNPLRRCFPSPGQPHCLASSTLLKPRSNTITVQPSLTPPHPIQQVELPFQVHPVCHQHLPPPLGHTHFRAGTTTSFWTSRLCCRTWGRASKPTALPQVPPGKVSPVGPEGKTEEDVHWVPRRPVRNWLKGHPKGPNDKSSVDGRGSGFPFRSPAAASTQIHTMLPVKPSLHGHEQG